MSRTLKYYPEVTCEICGSQGALDVYGDDICGTCLDHIDEFEREE